MNTNLPTHRTHRTALVIDVRDGVSGQFQERYNRLLESLNGPNIKVDVFTLRGNLSQSGPVLVAGSPEQTDETYAAESQIDLKAWAKGLGYTQLLISLPVQ